MLLGKDVNRFVSGMVIDLCAGVAGNAGQADVDGRLRMPLVIGRPSAAMNVSTPPKNRPVTCDSPIWAPDANEPARLAMHSLQVLIRSRRMAQITFCNNFAHDGPAAFGPTPTVKTAGELHCLTATYGPELASRSCPRWAGPGALAAIRQLSRASKEPGGGRHRPGQDGGQGLRPASGELPD